MHTLTIKIQDMFLYVRRTTGPDMVLLPNGGKNWPHETMIFGAGKAFKVDGAEISFGTWVNGRFEPIRAQGEKRAPLEASLIDLPTVLGEGVFVPNAALGGPVQGSINARIVLPAGLTRALPARREAAADVSWNFVTAAQAVVLEGVELTDVIETSVETSDTDPLFVLFSYRDGSAVMLPLTRDGDGNYQVKIQNVDFVCKGNPMVPAGEYSLDEYRLLYALTNAAGTDFPIPVGTYQPPGTMGSPPPFSECRPICGGANCPGQP